MAESASKNPPDGNIKKEAPRMQPLLFEALEADGSNYMEWSIDARAHLCTEELKNILEEPQCPDVPKASCWKGFLILRRHIDVSLHKQYIQTTELTDLWKQLVARFQHEK